MELRASLPVAFIMFATTAMSRPLDFSRFKIITFDCYGTLIDWENGILSAIRPILAAHSAQLSDPEVLRLYGELEAEAESGAYLSYREVLKTVVSGFGERLGFQASEAQRQSLPDSLRNWKPFPDTSQALRRYFQATCPDIKPPVVFDRGRSPDLVAAGLHSSMRVAPRFAQGGQL